MIVKDEIKILPRLFNSLHPHIYHYEVCDTGSQDGTADWIRRWMAQSGVSGQVHQDPWVNFAANRNACLLRLQQRVMGAVNGDRMKDVTHILLPDADFELIILNKEGFKQKGPPSAYNFIEYVGGPTFHSQPLLIGATSKCGYLGSCHEYLVCTDNRHAYELLMSRPRHSTEERIVIETSHRSPASPSAPAKRTAYSDIAFRHHYDGANRKGKFARDLQLLGDDVERDPSNPRAWFYYGQSLENAGHYDRAFEAYKKRAYEFDRHDVEAWYSVYRMGLCKMYNESNTIGDVAHYFVEAYNRMPSRREPLFPLTRRYREAGYHVIAKMYGTEALTIPFPRPPSHAHSNGQAIFSVDKKLYEWAFVDEVSISLYELGDIQGAARLLGSILNNTKLTLTTLADEDRTRMESNLKVFQSRNSE